MTEKKGHGEHPFHIIVCFRSCNIWTIYTNSLHLKRILSIADGLQRGQVSDLSNFYEMFPAYSVKGRVNSHVTIYLFFLLQTIPSCFEMKDGNDRRENENSCRFCELTNFETLTGNLWMSRRFVVKYYRINVFHIEEWSILNSFWSYERKTQSYIVISKIFLDQIVFQIDSI